MERVPGLRFGTSSRWCPGGAFPPAIFGMIGALGATVPRQRHRRRKSVGDGMLLTVGLVNTILGTASGARNIGTNGAIAVGGYIALAGLWAAPITGASMNPARSFAPDLVRGNFGTNMDLLGRPA